jgi:hypothetical protein
MLTPIVTAPAATILPVAIIKPGTNSAPRGRDTVTFYVSKSLALGPIRFGVAPRQEFDRVDDDPTLSTGALGEFLRKRTTGFYFADTKRIGAPQVPVTRSVNSTSLLSTLKPDGTARGWGFLAMMLFGCVLIFGGIAVLRNPEKINKAAGWVEIILGLAMIATPIVVNWKKRQAMLAQEEKERAEREERERRHREMLAAYTAALEAMRKDPSEANLALVARERAALDLPYDIWAPLARHSVLVIGFQALHRVGPARAREVHELMTHAASAAGLNAADETAVKLDLYRALVWHLLADDREGATQLEQLTRFRKGFDIWDRDVPLESKAVEEFNRLRGITAKSLPRQQCPRKLGFHEYCILSTRGVMMKNERESRKSKATRWVPRETVSIYVTNKRVLFDAGRKSNVIELPKIDDVEVDMDSNVLTITTGGGVKPVTLQVDDPIYTAALIDIATSIDERPKGFA